MYQNMFNPYAPSNPYMNQFQQQTQQKQGIIHVTGENGARAFQMAPNTDALMLDDTAPIVWLAQTDSAGYKTITPYSITPYKPDPPVDVKALEMRIARLEEALNAKQSVSTVPESDHRAVEQTAAATAVAPTANVYATAEQRPAANAQPSAPTAKPDGTGYRPDPTYVEYGKGFK